MSLMACTECGKQVSTQAKTCPACGAPAPKEATGPWMKVVLGAAALIFIISLVNKDGGSSTSSAAVPKAATPAAPVPAEPVLTAAEREDLIKRETVGLRLSRDKIEKVSFYQTPAPVSFEPSLKAYISIPDGSHAILRFNPDYTSTDWVFFERIKIMADDVIVFEKDYSREQISRDNKSGFVWETVDTVARTEEQKALRAVIKAKEVVIRFDGRDRRVDHKLAKSEQDNLAKVLKAFDGLKRL